MRPKRDAGTVAQVRDVVQKLVMELKDMES